MRILIVDDDPTFLFIFRKQIEKYDGIDILREAENGQEALTYLERCIEKSLPLPDLIVLDINMPVMDGWQFLNAYGDLKMTEEVPICILSSTINQADFDLAKKYDCVKEFFSKPVTRAQIEKIKSFGRL